MSGSSEVFPGARVYPDDARYRTLIRGFNQRWVGAPRYVQVVGSAEQIVGELQQCVDLGLRPTVRSGGHCYEGWVSLNDGVIIDVSGLTGCGWDADNGWFYLESGCTNWDVYNKLYRQFGVTLPAGSCYSVGAGGHIAGGGYGLLSREFGLTVDWLHGVEVVCVDADGRAELVRATADSTDQRERDLWWAHTGGGGGNFGVVTRYLFRDLPTAPAEVCLASFGWNWADLRSRPDVFHRLVENYGTFMEQNSNEDDPFSSLFALFHLTRSAAVQVGLTVQTTGPGRDLLRGFTAHMNSGLPVGMTASVASPGRIGHHRVLHDAAEGRVMPWLEATQSIDGSGANQRGKYKSAHMKKRFPDSQISVLWDWLTVENGEFPANSDALVQVDSYGCRINALGSDERAVPQRSSVMKLQYQTYWADPAGDAENLAWIRGVYTAMYGELGPRPDDVFDGCYVNYPDNDLTDWQTLYYGSNYARLQKAKRDWDPLNVFRYAQSIEP